MNLEEMRKFLRKEGKTEVEILRLTVEAFNFWQVSIAHPLNTEYNKIPF